MSNIDKIESYNYTIARELSDGLRDKTIDQEFIEKLLNLFEELDERLSDIQDPYVVSFFDGNTWKCETEDLCQSDAYRIWYQRTSGGKKLNNSKCDTYYHLGKKDEHLSGRHSEEEEEDDFSIGYLLNKSFG